MQTARFIVLPDLLQFYSSVHNLTPNDLGNNYCANVLLTLISTPCGRNDELVLYLQIVPASSIPDGWMGLDIGPDSIKTFNDALDTTKTIIWNGPMGVFEFDKFAEGTEVCRNFFFLIWFLPVQS